MRRPPSDDFGGDEKPKESLRGAVRRLARLRARFVISLTRKPLSA